MTLSTIRGAVGRVRNMYIVFTAAVASSDIAFYIAATHGGKEVASEIMENLQLVVAGCVVVYFADVLGAMFGQQVISAANLRGKFKEQEGNLGGKGRTLVRAAFSGASLEVLAYGVLFDAWWDLWMFYLGASIVLEQTIKDPNMNENVCKWDYDNSTMNRGNFTEDYYTTMPIPDMGTFYKNTNITFPGHSGFTIHYTTDGSDPTRESPIMGDSLLITKTTTLKYIFIYPDGSQSPIYTKTYYITGEAIIVTGEPASGDYIEKQYLKLKSNVENVAIYYTWDGSEPTNQSTQYDGPIDAYELHKHDLITDEEFTVIKWIGYGEGGEKSSVGYVHYEWHSVGIDPEDFHVTVTPEPGMYHNSVTIDAKLNQAGDLHYKDDGTTPDEDSPLWPGRTTITESKTFIFLGINQSFKWSPMVKAEYVIDTVQLTVQANPPGGTFTENVELSFSTSEQAKIYWTSDGTDPKTNGQPYENTIILTQNYTIKFYAKSGTGKISEVYTEYYVVDKSGPKPEAFRWIYIVSDYINNNDAQRAQSLCAELRSRGVTNCSYICHGPACHLNVLDNGQVPMSDNNVVVEIAGGADAGAIYEKGSRWYKNLLGNRKLVIWNCCGAKKIEGLAWLERAHDDNYSPSDFTGMAYPAQFLRDNGYFFIESDSIVDVADFIIRNTAYY